MKYCTVLRLKDQKVLCMSKVSNTLLKERSKAMSKLLKVVFFMAFMQHCVQSNIIHVTHVRGVEK